MLKFTKSGFSIYNWNPEVRTLIATTPDYTYLGDFHKSDEKVRWWVHPPYPAETTFRSLQPLYADYVVEADSVNSFKSRLDIYWANQEFVFNFNSELIATGGLPVCM